MNERNRMAFDTTDNRKPASRKGILIVFFLLFIPILATSFIPFFLTWFVFSTEMAQTNPKGCTETVYAVVIRNDARQAEDDDGGSHTEYAPVFRYKFGGNTYEVESVFADSKPRFEEGDEVQLMVDPNEPARIYDPGSRDILRGAYLLTLTFPAGVIIGAIFLGVILRMIFGKRNSAA